MHLTTLMTITLLPALSLALEPISSIYIAGSAISSIAGYFYYNYYLNCGKVECCQPPWVHESPYLDFSDLYGQGLAIQIVSNFLKRRSSLSNPLALSLHGPVGIGKTFFSSLLAKSLFKNGIKSSYVKYISVGSDFADKSKESEFHDKLKQTILSQLSKCDKSIFVFDEFEKMPPGVVPAIIPFLEHRGLVNEISTKNALFVFISNTGSKAIVAKAYELWKNKINRNDFKIENFEDVIRLAIFNEGGAYHNSELVKRDLIDAFVPFLPLEKTHVRSCITAAFWKLNKRKPTPEEVEEILAGVRFTTDNLFAETGCRMVDSLTLRFNDE